MESVAARVVGYQPGGTGRTTSVVGNAEFVGRETTHRRRCTVAGPGDSEHPLDAYEDGVRFGRTTRQIRGPTTPARTMLDMRTDDPRSTVS